MRHIHRGMLGLSSPGPASCCLLGAFLSSRLGGPRPTALDRTAPEVWRQRFGNNPALRNVTVFFAGVVVLVGARLAGGCTSGHGISGTLQLAVSGWLAVCAFFAGGAAVAFLLYGG